MLPGQALDVDQEAHGLSDGNGGVRVVHLEHRLVGQQVPVGAVLGLEASENILKGGATGSQSGLRIM